MVVASSDPAKGADSARTQAWVTIALLAVGSAKRRCGPTRATLRAPSVKTATAVPQGFSTTVRDGSARWCEQNAGDFFGGGDCARTPNAHPISAMIHAQFDEARSQIMRRASS